ncbi:hypothetical protein [Pontibacter actiniarum]|nr:hypothetical protein [Pontibacter actiniarum]
MLITPFRKQAYIQVLTNYGTGTKASINLYYLETNSYLNFKKL